MDRGARDRRRTVGERGWGTASTKEMSLGRGTVGFGITFVAVALVVVVVAAAQSMVHKSVVNYSNADN